MSPEQIIDLAGNGQLDPQWMVFRYNKTRAILVFFFKLFMAGLFLGIAGTFIIYSSKPMPSDLKIITYAIGSIGIIALLVLLRHIYNMFFFKTNMIVLTATEMIKSMRGKKESWTYGEISQLKQIISQRSGSIPVYSIEFTNKKTGKIVLLATGREFGPSQNIYTILRTKVS